MTENTKARPDRFDAFEKARENELIFTLLERDPCAPPSILHWCDLRRKIALEISDDDDRHAELAQITNAELIAFDMQARQKGPGIPLIGKARWLARSSATIDRSMISLASFARQWPRLIINPTIRLS